MGGLYQSQIISLPNMSNNRYENIFKIYLNEDNKFIALAVDGKAKYIISGDKHLLNLCKHKDIKIVTIGDFLGNI